MFRVTNGFSSAIQFRVTLASLKVEFYGSSMEKFRLKDAEFNFPDRIKGANLVYHEDIEIFDEMVSNMQAGIEKKTRLRMNALDGRNDWYLVEYIIQKDGDAKPEYVIGRIENVQIDTELRNKANLDMLTGCMNKGAFESFATNTLNPTSGEGQIAFMIVDIDNFKAVNDNLGHFFGDIALKEVSSKLKKHFRETDCIARIGGDEFAVLVQNISDVKALEEKAKRIIQDLDITYKGANRNYSISGSVGIALYPDHGQDYETIYKNADLALYHSKSAGKNTYTIYKKSMGLGTMKNATPFDVASRALSSYFDQEVAMDTFNLLFEESEDGGSVERVLRHLGQRFNVDRCYIFESTDDSCTVYDNTYEWCSKTTEPQIQNLQDVLLSEFAELFHCANEEGVFYCNDLTSIQAEATFQRLADQGIHSILHTYIKREGEVHYVLGFDDCTAPRIWTPMEISTLMYASKIIAQYLLYIKAIAYVYKDSQEKLNVLDSLNSFAYIVDVNTLEIYYYNKMTKSVVPNVELGDLCYNAFRGFDCQCEDCPLKLLKEHNAQKVRSVIYNKILDLHLLTTASYLSSFDGRECVFVSATDIRDIVEATDLRDHPLSMYAHWD